MDDLGKKAMELLVLLSPRRSAQGLLGLLLDNLHADAAGIYQIRGDDLKLRGSLGYDDADFEGVERAWPAHRNVLRAGGSFSDTSCALLALMGDSTAVGAIYLRARPVLALDHKALDVIRPMLTTAVCAEAEPSSPIEEYLIRTPTDDVEREQLRMQLKHHEYNVARVARLHDVSRPTMYHRLAKLGISLGEIREGRAGVRRPVTRRTE